MTTTQQPTIDQIRADVRAATADWLGTERAANVASMSPNQWLEISDDIAYVMAVLFGPRGGGMRTGIPCPVQWRIARH
jgi:hypothetical protein